MIVVEIGILLAIWWFSPFVFLPRPTEVVQSMGELWAEGLGGELLTSLALNAEAVAVATLLSLGLVYAARLPIVRPIVALVGKLRFLSLAGLTFFFTLAASNGHQLKLYLLVFSVSVFFVTGMADVIAGIPKEQYDLARTLGFGEWRVLGEVIVLGQVDKAFDVLRQNAAIGWVLLTMVEVMAREGGGIGTVLTDQNRHFHLSAVAAIQLIILALGLTQDYTIGLLRRMFCPYADLMVEKG